MRGIFFDTSIYINALRQGDISILSQRQGSAGRGESVPLWLSVVVLEELYIGAVGGKIKKLLGRFERDFEKINRLSVPSQSDWTTCGQVLGLIGRKYGFEAVKQARMTNDCLIGMTAARNGLTVYTHNGSDFKMIAEFRSFEWEEI